VCVLLFSQGKTLHIDYAAETITFRSGGCVYLTDLLVTNHSTEPVDRIHFVYPHPIPTNTTPESPAVSDYTATLLEDSSPYNEFYSTEYTSRTVVPLAQEDRITITMIDPSDVTKTLDYNGSVRGSQSLGPYEVSDDQQLTEYEWKILSELGWSVFTIKFTLPMKPKEPRWLRLHAETGVLPKNQMSGFERFLKRYLGVLVDKFEVAGPLDVRHRILSVLKATGMHKTSGTREEAISRMLRQDLYDKLVTRGIECPGTATLIKDWRLNVFTAFYRRCDEPTWWGDIMPCGPLINQLKSNSSELPVECYQWKAGDNNVSNKALNGFFGVRIQAHDEPLFRLLLPWIALAIALTSLALRFVGW